VLAFVAVYLHRAEGEQFTTIHSFVYSAPPNSGGWSPAGTLVGAGTTLYGTASLGGTFGPGTIFKLGIDGSGFTILYNFSATESDVQPLNSDGLDRSVA
jgi:uncharacterized repeat protein (TIGR03803 family)